MKLLFKILLCSLFAVSTCALAVESSLATKSNDTQPEQNVGGFDLHKLALEVGTRTHKKMLFDPRVRGYVDLGSFEPREVTFSLLLSILQLNGYTAVESEGLVQIVPDANVRQLALKVVAPDKIRTADDEWVTTIVPVSETNGAMLVPVLRPLLSQAAHFAWIEERGALIIVERSANVRRIVEIVRTLESLPQKPISK